MLYLVGKLISTDISKNLFFNEENLSIGNASSDSEVAVVNVFDEIEYQKILGFGGAFTESSAYNYSLLADENKKRFMEMYFNRQKGIGYNFGRTHINSCDFSLDIYSYVQNGDKTLETFDISRDKKYIIPFIKDAMKYSDGEIVCVILNSSNFDLPVNIRINGIVTEICIDAHTIKTFLLTESTTGESYED